MKENKTRGRAVSRCKAAAVVLALAMAVCNVSTLNSTDMKSHERKYYCEYCGHSFNNPRQLAAGTCSRHPDGSNRGRHKLYEGTEKSQYTCKYCGRQFRTIQIMVGGTCSAHPKGSNKGYHAPAL